MITEFETPKCIDFQEIGKLVFTFCCQKIPARTGHVRRFKILRALFVYQQVRWVSCKKHPLLFFSWCPLANHNLCRCHGEIFKNSCRSTGMDIFSGSLPYPQDSYSYINYVMCMLKLFPASSFLQHISSSDVVHVEGRCVRQVSGQVEPKTKKLQRRESQASPSSATNHGKSCNLRDYWNNKNHLDQNQKSKATFWYSSSTSWLYIYMYLIIGYTTLTMQ
jgi:hypothetical protein